MADLTNIKPANHDITFYSGDTFDLSFAVTKDNGDAYGLSGKTLKMQIKRDKRDSTSVYELTTTAGDIAISGASDNVVTFSKVMTLDEGDYVYDLQIDTDSYTIVYGNFKVTYDTTR